VQRDERAAPRGEVAHNLVPRRAGLAGGGDVKLDFAFDFGRGQRHGGSMVGTHLASTVRV
jgi:hypothetical protein